MHYKRVAVPSEYELTYGQESVSEEQLMCEGGKTLSPLSHERLPFHPLIFGKPWKIVTPELNTKTVEFWSQLSKVLKLTVDELYTVTIQNVVKQRATDLRTRQNYPDEMDKSQCNWSNEDVDGEFYSDVKNILLMVGNAELAAACACWIVKELPMGAEKVFALRAYLALTEKWSAASAPDSADKQKAIVAYNKHYKIYKRLATEQILYQHNMATEEFLQLAISPAKLIFQLYEHPSIVERFDASYGLYPDIHRMSDEIAAVNKVGVMKIRMTLVEKWLLSALGSKLEDADTTMTFNFQLNAPSLIDDDDNEGSWIDDNLKRVIYILENLPADSRLERLMVFASLPGSQEPASPEGKLRALLCALALTDVEKVALMAKVTVPELRLMTRNLKYLVALEALHIPHTLQSFETSNKLLLVRGIWKTHSRDAKAVKLMSRLCLDFKIYDVQLWNGIIKQMLAVGMVSTLRVVLPILADIVALPYFGCLGQAWSMIVQAPFSNAFAPLNEAQLTSCIGSLSLLRKCPVLHELNLVKISDQYMNLDLAPCALYCHILTGVRGKEHNIQAFLKRVDICDLLDQTRKLHTNGLHQFVVDDIKNVVFKQLRESANYTTLQKSSHFVDFLNYLISQDDIDNLLMVAVTSDRFEEASRLVMKYNNFHGLSVQETPQDQLKHYLKGKGMFDRVQDKFPDETLALLMD